jgi:hypothetical protein
VGKRLARPGSGRKEGHEHDRFSTAQPAALPGCAVGALAHRICPPRAARYVAAHLAALRAAAAIVTVKTGPAPAPRRKAPRSVWELLPRVEPALSEWSAFFAAGAGKRAAAEAGLTRAVTAREADDLLRDAGTFLSLAEEALGLPSQSPLPLRPAG